MKGIQQGISIILTVTTLATTTQSAFAMGSGPTPAQEAAKQQATAALKAKYIPEYKGKTCSELDAEETGLNFQVWDNGRKSASWKEAVWDGGLATAGVGALALLLGSNPLGWLALGAGALAGGIGYLVGDDRGDQEHDAYKKLRNEDRARLAAIEQVVVDNNCKLVDQDPAVEVVDNTQKAQTPVVVPAPAPAPVAPAGAPASTQATATVAPQGGTQAPAAYSAPSGAAPAPANLPPPPGVTGSSANATPANTSCKS